MRLYEVSSILTILSSARAGISVTLGGKRDSRRHSTTGFGENRELKQRRF